MTTVMTRLCGAIRPPATRTDARAELRPEEPVDTPDDIYTSCPVVMAEFNASSGVLRGHA